MNKLPSEHIPVAQPVKAPSAKELVDQLNDYFARKGETADNFLRHLSPKILKYERALPDSTRTRSQRFKAMKISMSQNEIIYLKDLLQENLRRNNCQFAEGHMQDNQISFASLCDMVLFATSKEKPQGEQRVFDYLISLSTDSHDEFKAMCGNINFGDRLSREIILIFLEVLASLKPSPKYANSSVKILEKWLTLKSNEIEIRQGLLIFYTLLLKKGELTPPEKKFLGTRGPEIIWKLKGTLFFQKYVLGPREGPLGKLLEIIVEQDSQNLDLGKFMNLEMIDLLQKMRKPPESLQKRFHLKHQKPVLQVLGFNEDEIRKEREEIERLATGVSKEAELNKIFSQWFTHFGSQEAFFADHKQALKMFNEKLPELMQYINSEHPNHQSSRKILDFLVLCKNFVKLSGTQDSELKESFFNNLSFLLFFLLIEDYHEGKENLSESLNSCLTCFMRYRHGKFGETLQVEKNQTSEKEPSKDPIYVYALRNDLFHIMHQGSSPNTNRMIEIFNTFLVLPLPSILEMFLHSDFDFFWQAYSQKYETALKYNSELRSFFVGGMGTEVFKHSILKRYFAPAETPRIAHCSAAERRATRIKSRAKRAIEQPQFRKQPVKIQTPSQINSGKIEVANSQELYQKDPNLYWILEVDGRRIKIDYNPVTRKIEPTGDDEIRDEFEDKTMTLHLVSSKLEATPQKIDYKSAKKAAILETPLEIDEAKWEEIKSNIRKRNLKTVSVKQLVKNWPEIEANVKMQDVCLCVRVGDKIVRRSMNSIIDFREFEWQDRQNSVEIFWGPKEGGEKTSWPKRTETLWVNPKEKTTSRPAEKPAPTPASAPAKAVRARADRVAKVVETGDEDLYLEFLDDNYQTEISESEVVFVFSEKNKRISVKKSGENWEVNSSIVKDIEFKKALLEVAKEKWGEWKEKEDQKKAAQKQVSINSNNLSKIKKKHRSLPKIYEKFAQTARSFSPLDLVDKNGNLIFGWRDLQDLVRFLGSNGVQIEFTNENQFKISAAKMEVVVQFNYTGRCIFVRPSVPDPSQGWIKEIFEFGVFHFLKNAKKLAENRRIMLERKEVERTIRAIESRKCRVPIYHPNGEYDRPRKLAESEILEAENLGGDSRRAPAIFGGKSVPTNRLFESRIFFAKSAKSKIFYPANPKFFPRRKQKIGSVPAN